MHIKTKKIVRSAVVTLLVAFIALPLEINPFTTVLAGNQALTDQLIESGFSPKKGSKELVLKVIDTAKHNICLAAYSFTSPVFAKALLKAKKRGVDVKIIVDKKGNTGQANKAALHFLAQAKIPIRLVSKYAIHHDKYMIVDGIHVQTGSLNYSKAAVSNNSENVLVIWNNQLLAEKFLEHWQSKFDDGLEFIPDY